MPTIGEMIPVWLERLGIDVVFGIPGVHTVELYRGLPRSGLRHITPRHEQGAGFMADGYARASGRPAACFIITGPGMLNIATAIGQAASDSVPMLVIGSSNRRAELGRNEGRLHELRDQFAVIAGIARHAERPLQAGQVPAALARAMAACLGPRPGPAYVELPLDLFEEPAEGLDLPALPAASIPAPSGVGEIAGALSAAASPLLVVGGGAVAAGGELAGLLRRFAVPTMLTIAGKGLLPPDHCCLLGAALSSAAGQDALKRADLVLAVGTELSETDHLLFGAWPETPGHLVRVDICPDQLRRRPVIAGRTSGIRADAAEFLAALAAALPEGSREIGSEVRAVRQAHAAAAPQAYHEMTGLLSRLRDAVPGVIMAGDSTQPVYAGNMLFDAAAPRCWFNSATGFGTLGYGLPAAIGAQIALPDRPVLALCGDGGVQFSLPELAVCAETGQGPVVVIWNNRGYGEIAQWMDDRAIRRIGVDVFAPDFGQIAGAYGLPFRQVPADGALDAITAALEARRPAIIEVLA